MQFETVIGLEVHVQLNTKTKMFCSCANIFGSTANENTCPVCLALPGVLPVPNKQAFAKAIAFGTAVQANINQTSIFDRKSYFYPDSPKAYQISQFYLPIVEHGFLEIDSGNNTKKIGITRAHLEEDAGKNIHHNEFSAVNLNRAGTPLLEIVSEPDLRTAEEAVNYLKKLHTIVRYIDISDANMQEGSFRCDANVSIRPKGKDKLYTKVEIKNINSFKFIQKAIEGEVKRQIQAFEDGIYDQEIVQETRLYDSINNETRSMRGKEGSADYRYFKDPDIMPIKLEEDFINKASKIPELPDQKQSRFMQELGLNAKDAAMITTDLDLLRFYETMLSYKKVNVKTALSWLSVELLGRLNKLDLDINHSPVNAQTLVDLIVALEQKTINGKAAKGLLDHLMTNKSSVQDAIKKLGLEQINNDDEIKAIVLQVLQDNPKEVEQYKAGKVKLLGFFVGLVMKASRGKANPASVNQIIKDSLV